MRTLLSSRSYLIAIWSISSYQFRPIDFVSSISSVDLIGFTMISINQFHPIGFTMISINQWSAANRLKIQNGVMSVQSIYLTISSKLIPIYLTISSNWSQLLINSSIRSMIQSHRFHLILMMIPIDKDSVRSAWLANDDSYWQGFRPICLIG